MAIQRIRMIGDSASDYFRKVCDGLGDYAKLQPGWILDLRTSRRQDLWMDAPRPDALVGQFQSEPELHRVGEFAIPFVTTSSHIPITNGVTRVVPDNAAIGRLAAETLIDHGFVHFGFLNLPDVDYATVRGKAFVARLAEAGFTAEPLRVPRGEKDTALVRRLARLPRPMAVFAPTDAAATLTMAFAWRAEYRIPQDFAFLGVDNDNFITNQAPVPLSSIELPLHHVGYLAAQTLDRMLQGDGDVPAEQTLPPVCVHLRGSLGLHATTDSAVQAALACIAEHHCNPNLQVADIVSAASVGRRSLEKRFARELGQTILQCLLDTRVRHTQQLLRSTDLPIGAIAIKAGFNSPTHLGVAFRRITGQTPSDFRRKSRELFR